MDGWGDERVTETASGVLVTFVCYVLYLLLERIPFGIEIKADAPLSSLSA
jgi:hypothetical protein